MYTVKGGKVEIDLGVLRIPEFKALWDRDYTTEKHRANAELDFIYQVCDYKSTYRKRYREQELVDAVIADFLLKFPDWKIDAIMNAAIGKYLELRDTSSYQDYKAIDSSMNEIRKLCKNFSIPSDLGAKDKADLANAHLNMIKNYDAAFSALQNIRKKVEEDMIQLDNVGKGGSVIRDRERRIDEQRQIST